jgi:hypothetical protein
MVEDRYAVLPTGLLEGFVSRITGNHKLTFLYEKGKKTLETNISNPGIASENTDLEGEFASLLDSLREPKGQTEISGSRVSEFLQHLSAQACHTRNRLRQSPEFLFEKLYEFMLDSHNLQALILHNSELIKEHFDRASVYIPALKFYKGVLQLEPTALIAFLNRYRSMTEMAMQTFVAKYKAVIIEKLRSNPIQILPIPEYHPNYQSLRWLTCKSETPLILGDAGCLFETAGTDGFKSLLDKDDVIKNVFLPVSHNQMLIGTSMPAVPRIDVHFLNEAAAKSSEKFFVSSKNSSEHTRLIPFIGKESQIISKKELERFLTEMVRESDKWLNMQAK